jgi:hypothetical protein
MDAGQTDHSGPASSYLYASILFNQPTARLGATRESRAPGLPVAPEPHRQRTGRIPARRQNDTGGFRQIAYEPFHLRHGVSGVQFVEVVYDQDNLWYRIGQFGQHGVDHHFGARRGRRR